MCRGPERHREAPGIDGSEQDLQFGELDVEHPVVVRDHGRGLSHEQIRAVYSEGVPGPLVQLGDNGRRNGDEHRRPPAPLRQVTLAVTCGVHPDPVVHAIKGMRDSDSACRIP